MYGHNFMVQLTFEIFNSYYENLPWTGLLLDICHGTIYGVQAGLPQGVHWLHCYAHELLALGRRGFHDDDDDVFCR